MGEVPLLADTGTYPAGRLCFPSSIRPKVLEDPGVQGYLAHKKIPTPWDRHGSLGTVLL